MAEEVPEVIGEWNEFIKHAGALKGDTDGGTVACFIVDMLSKKLEAVDARLEVMENDARS